MEKKMTAIIDIRARQIFDSRGTPTVEVDVTLDGGATGRASVPSGASTGVHEACELRDGDAEYLHGKGVLKAVENVNREIADALRGLAGDQQGIIDSTLIQLDGTPNKSRLGANAILGVSLATARAAAHHFRMPLYRYLGGVFANRLPVPLMNVLNGGCHADNSLEIQEFMLLPLVGDSFQDMLLMGVNVFQSLKALLKSKGYSTNVGDEGGFAPMVSTASEALDLLSEASIKAGYIPGEDLGFALDVAASGFYRDGKYHLEGRALTADALVGFYGELAASYPLLSIEDGMAEDDWKGWEALTAALGSEMQLVGDDVFVTNPERLTEGLSRGVANSILIKPNQIGTLSETMMVVQMAHDSGYSTIMSHRSGETEDPGIADLSVAFGCDQIKTGSLSRTDRMAKYNQLLRIEEALAGVSI